MWCKLELSFETEKDFIEFILKVAEQPLSDNREWRISEQQSDANETIKEVGSTVDIAFALARAETEAKIAEEFPLVATTQPTPVGAEDFPFGANAQPTPVGAEELPAEELPAEEAPTEEDGEPLLEARLKKRLRWLCDNGQSLAVSKAMLEAGGGAAKMCDIEPKYYRKVLEKLNNGQPQRV